MAVTRNRDIYYNRAQSSFNSTQAGIYNEKTPDALVKRHQSSFPDFYRDGERVTWNPVEQKEWPAQYQSWKAYGQSQPAPTVPQTVNSTEVNSTNMIVTKPVFLVGTLTRAQNVNNGTTVNGFNDNPTGVVACETEAERDRVIALRQQGAITAMNGNPGIIYEVFVAKVEGLVALPTPTITSL